jgi:hypothetical protein
MKNLYELNPECCVAKYTPARLPRQKGNPLIEALPPVPQEEQLLESLTKKPPFEAEQRQWPTEERIEMLESLMNFRVPLQRHAVMSSQLNSMIRNGYVGRAPRTADHAKRYQSIYEKGFPVSQQDASLLDSAGQSSTLLIGISGMGKTSFIKHWCSQMPQLIYHPSLNVYQVTYLHVEMPSDGSSIKGLAHGILSQLDKLLPTANYYETFALRGKPGADALMRSVARLLHMHHVGILIADEVQNITNSHKSQQTVMTELVSACNELGLPIVFVGTNKAKQVFSLDFRQARRASGRGMSYWGPLERSESMDSRDEWDEFLEELFQYQWVRNPVDLDAELRETMYDYSQGVVDIALKLFVSAQAHAMQDQSERVTVEHLDHVYSKEMALLHPMLRALRDKNLSVLSEYDDIAPLNVHEYLERVKNRVQRVMNIRQKEREPDSVTVDKIASALVTQGFDESECVDAAQRTFEAGEFKDLPQAVAKAVKLLNVSIGVPTLAQIMAGLESTVSSRPNDYRNAYVRAHRAHCPVEDKMSELGFVRPLEELLDLA